MTKEREALRMALEALHGFIPYLPLKDEAQCGRYDQAITAIKEALAQLEQEPVAYIHRNEYNEYRLEPHDNFDIKSIPFNVDVLLFKAPQRKPLTVEQRNEIARQADENDWHDYDIIDAVEAAHGIKGEA